MLCLAVCTYIVLFIFRPLFYFAVSIKPRCLVFSIINRFFFSHKGTNGMLAALLPLLRSPYALHRFRFMLIFLFVLRSNQHPDLDLKMYPGTLHTNVSTSSVMKPPAKPGGSGGCSAPPLRYSSTRTETRPQHPLSTRLVSTPR